MAENAVYTCPDVVLRSVNGAWMASNARARTHVELNSEAARLVLELSQARPIAVDDPVLSGAVAWDRTGFSSALGLTRDPSGMVARNSDSVSGLALVKLLIKRLILISDEERYETYFRPLTNILDREHLGTFHQRVGQHLVLDRREREKWRWWQSQKFTDDGLSVRDGPYRWIQEAFFDAYFGNEALTGSKILDFGCGNGHYSRKFRDFGASVVGLDTSSELIQFAKSRPSHNIKYIDAVDVEGVMSTLRSWESDSYDIVYMSDTFLLLNSSPDDLTASIPLLTELSRLINRGGRVILFEPNAVFWLASRMGGPNSQVAIISEYRSPLYNVAPTIDRVVTAFGKVGLALSEYVHPYATSSVDADSQFSSQFPIWDFLTFRRQEKI